MLQPHEHIVNPAKHVHFLYHRPRHLVFFVFLLVFLLSRAVSLAVISLAFLRLILHPLAVSHLFQLHGALVELAQVSVVHSPNLVTSSKLRH